MSKGEPVRTFSPDKALSRRMSVYPRRETRPEVALRSALHRRGLRFRVHYPVPGSPRRKIDVAFPGAKIAVFVDGCFWHACPEHAVMPKANSEWWAWKLHGNTSRDAETTEMLEQAGWQVIRLWEHQTPEDGAAQVVSMLAHSRP
jgi:DNA mismatch endonuclease (patch repair protein)